MDDADREALVGNIVGHACDGGRRRRCSERVVAYWTNVDADLGASVAAGLGQGNGKSANPRAQQVVTARANRA